MAIQLVMVKTDGTGGPNPNVQLNGASILGVGNSENGTAKLKFYSNGTVEKEEEFNGGGYFGYINIDPWWTLAPTVGIGNSFEIKVSVTGQSGGGSFTGPAVDTWHSLSTDREWILDDISASRDLEIQIRTQATGTVDATGTYTMQVVLL